MAGFGWSASSKAAWEAKDYEKQQKDAIMIENLRAAVKLPKAAVIYLKPTKIDIDFLTFDHNYVNTVHSGCKNLSYGVEWSIRALLW